MTKPTTDYSPETLDSATTACFDAWINYYKHHKKEIKTTVTKDAFKELKHATEYMISFGVTPKFKKYAVSGFCSMVPLYFNIKSPNPSYVLYNQKFLENMWLTDSEENAIFCRNHIDRVDKTVKYGFQVYTYDKKLRCFWTNGNDTAQYAAGRCIELKEFAKNNMTYGLGHAAITMMSWLEPKDVKIEEITDEQPIEIPIKKVFLNLPFDNKLFIGTYFNDTNSFNIEQIEQCSNN